MRKAAGHSGCASGGSVPALRKFGQIRPLMGGGETRDARAQSHLSMTRSSGLGAGIEKNRWYGGTVVRWYASGDHLQPVTIFVSRVMPLFCGALPAPSIIVFLYTCALFDELRSITTKRTTVPPYHMPFHLSCTSHTPHKTPQYAAHDNNISAVRVSHRRWWWWSWRWNRRWKRW